MLVETLQLLGNLVGLGHNPLLGVLQIVLVVHYLLQLLITVNQVSIVLIGRKPMQTLQLTCHTLIKHIA